MKIKYISALKTTVLAIIVSLLLVVLFALSNTSQHSTSILGTGTGSTYYIATNGNNSNSGSASSPWRTIQHGVNTARAGDTVIVNSGTYRESISFSNHSGTSQNKIVFTTSSSNPAVVEGTLWSGFYFGGAVQHITIENFEVKNSVGPGILIDNASRITIQNCKINNNREQGIIGYAESGPISNISIIGCTVNKNGGEGIYFTMRPPSFYPVTDNLIQDNLVFDNTHDGIQNTHPSQPEPAPNNTIIRGNTLYNNGDWAEMDISGNNILIENNTIHSKTNAHIGGIWYANGDGSIIQNNLIYKVGGRFSGGDGGIVADRASNLTIRHNTIYSHTKNGIKLQSPKANNLVINNILSQNGTQQITTSGGQAPTVSHNLIDGNSTFKGNSPVIGTPSFVSATQNNYRLSQGSIAIDAGQPNSLNQDIENKSRPNGAGYDIGAYEYEPTSSSSTTSSTSTSTATSTTTLSSSSPPSTSTISSSSSRTTKERTCKADYDSDGIVGVTDLSVFAANYKITNIDCNLDLVNDDCYLDISDLSHFSLLYKVNSICSID